MKVSPEEKAAKEAVREQVRALTANPDLLRSVEEFDQGKDSYMMPWESATFAALEERCIEGGNFRTKRTCDHCGAAFNFGVFVEHKPSGAVLAVGYICAQKLDGRLYRARRVKLLKDRAAKVRFLAKQSPEAAEAYLKAEPLRFEGSKADMKTVRTIVDICERSAQYKKPLSEKQLSYLSVLAAKLP